ncbi:MAG TPA: nitroreductase family protein, partial [Streptosporangiaceae bacterium]
MTEIAKPEQITGTISEPDAAAQAAPQPGPAATPIPLGQVEWLLATASRAPSVHNTQPWQFKVDDYAIELHADPDVRLRVDRGGREMLISCGAALFGLRLAVRGLGYLPDVDLLPDKTQPDLLPDKTQPDLIARVTLGREVAATEREKQLLAAIPHRHTHRGAFEPGTLPAGLLPGLQHDALSEEATLAIVGGPTAYPKLAALVADASRVQALSPVAREEVLRWSRAAGSRARDGVSALAFPQTPDTGPGRLAQRDFDLGRHIGRLPAADPAGPPPAATAVLLTRGDSRADWLHAGQALHRVLLHAATVWVFASPGP